MEHGIAESVEKLFYEKITGYNDLLSCLKDEKEALINVDLDDLWLISHKKEEICANLESVREKIISTIASELDYGVFNFNRIMDLIPGENMGRFQKLSHTLIALKGEIDVLRKENMKFVDESLNFLDEMISVITGETKARTVYNEKCYLSKPGDNILFSRKA